MKKQILSKKCKKKKKAWDSNQKPPVYRKSHSNTRPLQKLKEINPTFMNPPIITEKSKNDNKYIIYKYNK